MQAEHGNAQIGALILVVGVLTSFGEQVAVYVVSAVVTAALVMAIDWMVQRRRERPRER